MAGSLKEAPMLNHQPRRTCRSRGPLGSHEASGLALPQGSGAVESAVRRVVNQRMKANSIYWTEDHAEDVLHLRAFLKAGRCGEVIDAHLRRPVWVPVPIGQAA